MRILKSLMLLTLLLMISCTSTNNSLSSKDESVIQTELKNNTIKSLRSWEPPFSDETFINEFSHSEDLLIVIDDFVMRGYTNWKNAVISSMQEEREKEYKKYTHIIDNIYVSVLSKTSAVVTVLYTWDYITKDDLHFNVKAHSTSGYKKVNDNWERVQFIVSHGEEKQIK